MTDPFELRVWPRPPAEHREAILRAVREVLEREAELARPPAWTLAGWAHRRTGVTDLGRLLPNVWRLSARLPWGGREHPGLIGRGDAR